LNKKRILFVEDSPDDVELALLAFKEARFEPEISVACDGTEALAALEKDSARGSLPDVVVTDLKMPKLSGLDLIRRLRADRRFRGVAVAVLTSSDDPSDRRTARELGAALYLAKPLSLEGYETIARQLETLALSAERK
jgi:two-component system response regulator